MSFRWFRTSTRLDTEVHSVVEFLIRHPCPNGIGVSRRHTSVLEVYDIVDLKVRGSVRLNQ